MLGKKGRFYAPPSLAVPLLLAAGFAALGCAPKTNHAVEAARREYLQASSDPVIAEHAAGELNKARTMLGKAETQLKEGDEPETEHLARVAATQVETARHVGRAEAAQSETKRLEKELAELKARETEQGLALTLSDVLFEVDSDRLKPQATRDLALLAAFVSAHPDREVVIEGHTDSTGSPAYNLMLSRRRAETVESFLVASGIDPARLHPQGFGRDYPVASNATAAGRAMNRRVEMLVLNPGAAVSLSSSPAIRYEVTRRTVTR